MSDKKDEEELELDWGDRKRGGDGPGAQHQNELSRRFGTDPRPPVGAAAHPTLQRAAAKPVGGFESTESFAALEPLFQETQIRVQQERQFAESLVGVELRNRYRVIDGSGRTFLDATETGGGIGDFFVRQFMRSGRAFQMDVTPPSSGTVALRLERPFTWFISRLEITGWNGQRLGTVQQRWRFFSRRLDLLSPEGRLLAYLYGPVFKPWTFQLMRNEQEVGRIEKRWSGLLVESITNADDFSIRFQHGVDPRLRQLTLGAVFLIDFLYFERRGRRSLLTS